MVNAPMPATSAPLKSVLIERSAGGVSLVLRPKVSFWVLAVVFGVLIAAMLYLTVSCLVGTAKEPEPNPVVACMLFAGCALLVWLSTKALFEVAGEEFRLSGDQLSITASLFGIRSVQAYSIAQVSHVRFAQVVRRTKNGRRIVRLILFNAGLKEKRSRRDLTPAEGEVVYRFLAEHLPPSALALRSGLP